jgi:hypothetical protein
MALRIHRRCATPPNRRIERDLHSQLDRSARRRNAGAYADQPAQAPEGRAARHHARPRISRVRRCRPRLHRRGRRPVVRVAGIRLGAARRGRRRADAHARLLPPLSPPLARAGGRARRDAAQNRTRAHGARGVPVLGFGGKRHRGEARLVLLECGRRAATHQDHRAPHGLPRQHVRRRQPVGKARYACGLRLAVCALQAHRISPLLPPPRAGRDGDAVFRPYGRGAGDAHPGGRSADDCRVFRRAGHGRRCTSTTFCSWPTR